MPKSSFDYAIIRVVPRVERGERINAGVIVFSATNDFLTAEIAVDRPRLAALWPGLDLDELERALAVIPKIAAGDPVAGAVAALPRSERFHWLVAPRSTMIQTSRIHTGLCDAETLAGTVAQLVLRLVRA